MVREAEDQGLHTEVGYPSLRELLHHVQGISRREAAARIEHAKLRVATEVEVAPEQYEMMRRLGRELPNGLPADAEIVLAQAAKSLDAKAMEPLGRELAARIDPDGPQPVEPKEHRRELYVSTRADGSVSFRGKIDPEAGQVLTSALDVLAKPRSAKDPRDLAERNGDAFAEFLHGKADRAHVTVTIPLSELDSEPSRRLACDAKIIPMVLGTRSVPLDVGRASTRYPRRYDEHWSTATADAPSQDAGDRSGGATRTTSARGRDWARPRSTTSYSCADSTTA
ncbi:hypothetical protein BC739_001046 [Kutzneria viridogrisea]|uniref:DUF222 domain-containing protein n=1 Tax=Kutzneria viridogrisea TaxID=47990 RepID=A0ABR6BAH3_9PSEU|nr:hypothetical protein [Kutzneria viridogrisea]